MEVLINKDIREYKVKDIGPLTLRQFLGLVLIAIGCYGMHFLSISLFGTQNEFLYFVGALPGVCLGFVNFQGIPFEKMAKIIIMENFINPRVRPFETDTMYNLEDFVSEEELVEIKELDSLKKQKTKIPKELKKELKAYK